MHLGMSYTELQRLPVRYRHWYIKRLSKHFEKKNDIMNGAKSKEKISIDAPLARIEEIFNKKLE